MWHHFDHSTTVNGVKVIYPSSLTIDVELAYLQCLDTVIYITNSNKLGLTISDKRDTPKMRKFHIIKYPAPNTILSTRSINGVFGRLHTARNDSTIQNNNTARNDDTEPNENTARTGCAQRGTTNTAQNDSTPQNPTHVQRGMKG